MKKLALIIITLFVSASIASAVPEYINYQGILRDSSGNSQNGSFDMVFKIYSGETGGRPVYNSGTQTVAVTKGLYNVELGPITSPTVFDGGARWLGITVDGETLSPRLKINSVAYAITAENVEDDAITTSKIADDAVTGDKLADDIDITTTGNLASNNVTINNKLNVTGLIIGKDVIEAGSVFKQITNAPITDNSKIFLTVGNIGSKALTNANGGIRISDYNVAGELFRVARMGKTTDTSVAIPFSYIIIN